MREILTVVALIFWIVWTVNAAGAHEHDGMKYDSWCCNNQDCAPAKVQFLGDGKIKATTKHGTAVFDLQTIGRHRIKPSTDGQYHACIPWWGKTDKEKARCLYVPAGI